jgi:spermidine synthase
MGLLFEELDHQPTPLGEISLRRRREPSLDVDVYEARLDDEFLMSSLFTVAEAQLAQLALDELRGGDLDVAVGGLGLGYTAAAALDDPRVRSLVVVEALAEVIDWHERGLVPLGERLSHDPRCSFRRADFFALVDSGTPLKPDGSPCDAVLLDIDHTPQHLLHQRHASFYSEVGLTKLAAQLRPGGVFALWSDAAPDDAFLASLGGVFTSCRAEVVAFPNPYTGGSSTNTIYLGSTAED